jgi:hypothetical protein
VNDTVVKLKPKKAKKKGTKGGKKVTRGLKQAIERTNEGLDAVTAEARAKLSPEKRAQLEEFDELGKIDDVDAWHEKSAIDCPVAPGKIQPEEHWYKKPDFAERVAAAINTSWQRFLYKLPRLVWVDQRVNVSIRLTPEGQIGVFYHSKFNPKAI